jgi:5'-deoxynucleotidase YfbR-like HD superfamily hydrolase
MPEHDTNDDFVDTISGKRVYLMSHSTDAFDIADISHALSMISRFTGHVSRPYSVAEHSLLVAGLVADKYGVDNPQLLMAALMHDASEAYLTDVPSPIKAMLLDYKAIEHHITARINTAFNIHGLDYAEQVKHADWLAVLLESTILRPHSRTNEWANWPTFADEVMALLPEIKELMLKEEPTWKQISEAFTDTFNLFDDMRKRQARVDTARRSIRPVMH